MPGPGNKNKREKLACKNKSILSFFPRLMSSVTPQKNTNEATLVSDSNVALACGDLAAADSSYCSNQSVTAKPKNKCPYYKWIPGTPFTVDAFRYGLIRGCSGYFLSHFHYDHYGGLSSKFKGTIYCSRITANLVRKTFGQSVSVVVLPTNEFVIVNGYEILLIDANHCPGSVMILLRLPEGGVHLHTGDFRVHSSMLQAPSILADFVKTAIPNSRIGTVFLDTTFCDPYYKFPEQQLVIAAAAQVSFQALLSRPDTLILCGMYSIGKERFVLGLAEELNVKVWLPNKQRGLVTAASEGGCEVCRALVARCVASKDEARIHVVDMNELNPRAVLKNLLPMGKNIIAWKPSGWMYNPSKKATAATIKRLPCPAEAFESLREFISVEMVAKNVVVLGAAYSEHSSFTELKDFITALKPMKVQPTVFGGSAKDARKHIDSWLQEEKLLKLPSENS
uniref:DRMBL domain-containing protein n=2 Tax=Mesocestoides corti TaxID=53468 RepID=A0A5K3EM61_MESCO